MPSTTETRKAFDKFRKQIGAPRDPDAALIRNTDETRQMTEEEGLETWIDGTTKSSGVPDSPPLLEAKDCVDQSLWVIRQDDVVHAKENCAFGKGLASGVIKHTNLTGGAKAYSGGELLFLDPHTMVVNGRSGRYGPRTKAELSAAAQAFADSGYRVWYMGWDEETNRPAPFVG